MPVAQRRSHAAAAVPHVAADAVEGAERFHAALRRRGVARAGILILGLTEIAPGTKVLIGTSSSRRAARPGVASLRYQRRICVGHPLVAAARARPRDKKHGLRDLRCPASERWMRTSCRMQTSFALDAIDSVPPRPAAPSPLDERHAVALRADGRSPPDDARARHRSRPCARGRLCARRRRCRIERAAV